MASAVGGGSLPGRDPCVGRARRRAARARRPSPVGCAPAIRRSSAGSRTARSISTCGPWIRPTTPRSRVGPRRTALGRAMTVVVGTAGHIDHGKTALLRALTGIDADRLPEERRRGMTIDVGYAHFALPDGSELDFVDVPGSRPAGRQHAGRRGRDRCRDACRRGRRRAARPDDRAPRAARRPRDRPRDRGHHQDRRRRRSPRIAEVREAVERLLAGRPWPVRRSSPPRRSAGAGHRRRSPGPCATCATGWSPRRRALRRTPRPGDVAPRDRPRSSRSRVAGLVVTGTLRGGPLVRNATLRLVPGERHRSGPARCRSTAARSRRPVRAGPRSTSPASTRRPSTAARPDRRPTASWPAIGSSSGFGGRCRTGRAPGSTSGPRPWTPRSAAPVATPSIWPTARRPRSSGSARRSRSPPAIGSSCVRVPGRSARDRRRSCSTWRPRVASRAGARRPSGSAASPTAIEARDEAAAIDAARLDLHGAIATAGSAALADDVREAASADVVAALGAWAATPDARPGLAEVRVAWCADPSSAGDPCVATRRRVAATALIDRPRQPWSAGPRRGRTSGCPASIDPSQRRRRSGAGSCDGPARGCPRGRRARRRCRSRARRRLPAAGIRELERTGRIVLLDDDLAYEAATYREHRGAGARSRTSGAADTGEPCATPRRRAASTSWPSSRTSTGARSSAEPRQGTSRVTARQVRSTSAPGATRSPAARRPSPKRDRRRVSAIVLAGGRSSRFGRDKLARTDLGGRSLLDHAIDRRASRGDRDPRGHGAARSARRSPRMSASSATRRRLAGRSWVSRPAWPPLARPSSLSPPATCPSSSQA